MKTTVDPVEAVAIAAAVSFVLAVVLTALGVAALLVVVLG